MTGAAGDGAALLVTVGGEELNASQDLVLLPFIHVTFPKKKTLVVEFQKASGYQANSHS